MQSCTRFSTIMLLALMWREKGYVSTAEKRALLKSPGSPQLLCAKGCYPSAKTCLSYKKEQISKKWSKLKCLILFLPKTNNGTLV